MSDQLYNVLFLCTHNSARSIMAECILNRIGQGRFKAYSAGSQPSGRLNPMVLDLLQRLNYPIQDLRSKDWAEFATPDAPVMDFVFTVCDQAAGEVCPIWPGQPMTAHWGFPDPSSFTGTDVEIKLQVAEVYRQIERRLELFTALPLRSLDRLALRERLHTLSAKPAPTETATHVVA